MKVTVCPVCRITPDFTSTEVKCPKCGRRAVGGDLTETLTKWNNGVVEAAKPEKIKPAKEEIKPVVTDEEVAKSFIEDVEAVKEVLEKPKKAVKGAAKTTSRKR